MSAKAQLRDAIERSYAAFASMPRPVRLEGSPLRDLGKILRTLTSAPLRELSGEQIGPYSGWAITTVGSERDYRFFLPRIFELSVTDPVWLGAEPPIMADRLIMASWQQWPADQQSAVLNFFRAAFEAALETHPYDGQSADTWYCGLIRLGKSPSHMMELWRSVRSPNAALQLGSFIVRESRHLNRHEEVKGPFWEEVDVDVRHEVAVQLKSDATRGFLEAANTKVADDDRFQFLDAAVAELQRQY